MVAIRREYGAAWHQNPRPAGARPGSSITPAGCVKYVIALASLRGTNRARSDHRMVSAGVAELADAGDLKSPARKGVAGSTPASGTTRQPRSRSSGGRRRPAGGERVEPPPRQLDHRLELGIAALPKLDKGFVARDRLLRLS